MGFVSSFLSSCCAATNDDQDENDTELKTIVSADGAVHLSYIGKAAYEVLRTGHGRQHKKLWHATSGEVVGSVYHTPNNLPFHAPNAIDPGVGHSDWFPHQMGAVLQRTEIWADVMSLGPPDGLFMDVFQSAIRNVALRAKKNNRKVIIRMMFGNIIGTPLNCTKLVRDLTCLVPAECEEHLNIWVGAWRKGLSWNHSKIIAVDGIYLLTGGHNLWEDHYLKESPVHDLSVELKGKVAHDGHLFSNDQWDFVQSVQATCCGAIADRIPDGIPLLTLTHVALSEYPKGQTTIFPPTYRRSLVAEREKLEKQKYTSYADDVPMLTMGRYGSLLRYYRAADDAFLAMFAAAKRTIKLAIQDLGPVCIPGTSIALPGCVWPKEYLTVLAKAIQKGVVVDIVLSNPLSIPGGLSFTEANYGNGWSCVDVAAEIIKCYKTAYPAVKKEVLRKKLENNLRVCFIRRGQKPETKWENGMNIALHSKHFIVDDRCAYIGSQNLYIVDLAEWGVVIDHKTR